MSRLGGEEFVLLLSHADGSAAQTITEGLRKHIQAQPITSIKGTTLFITFSAGVAEFKAEETLEQLIHRADTALYAAKQNGRNQVIIA